MSEHESTPTAASTPPKKASSVRHTRAIARARSKQPPQPPPDEVIAARLSALIHPLTMSQVTQYAQLGLRQRLLTLPVMVALVLSMIWRQVGSVSTLVLLLERQGFLWTGPLCVSQQALSLRLRVFPAVLFRQVLDALLPQMAVRAQERTRPLPPELAWANEHFSTVLAVDGSTLDGLLKQVGLLRDRPDTPLAGRMTALLELCVRLPRALWYEPDEHAHDLRCWPQILAALPAGALLLVDLGYTNFAHFAQLTRAHVTFVTRAKSNLAATLVQPLRHTSTVHDDLVWIGQGDDRQQVRRISVLYQGKW